eukprot:g12581.t1
MSSARTPSAPSSKRSFSSSSLSPVFQAEKYPEFGIHNLPFGVFSTKRSRQSAAANGNGINTKGFVPSSKHYHEGATRIGVAVGSKILDCAALADLGVIPCSLKRKNLNSFMAEEKTVWAETRTTLQEILADFDGFCTRHNLARGADELLVDRLGGGEADQEVQMHLPCRIGDYTDFYASRDHATNVGKMFRDPENALLPNWLHIPVGYHGRASSVQVSGTPVFRPCGQTVAKDAPHGPPSFGPSKLVDFELEVGAFVGGPDMEMGDTLTLQQAEDRLFGLVLDIQKWEYVPLGPFCAKNFGTIISPWIVPMAALEPFRVPTPPQNDPTPLPYLQQKEGAKGNFDVSLTVDIETPAKSNKTVTKSNLRYMHWSLAQQLAHHASSGCNMRAGDLIGTGTISGPSVSERGCLLELTWAGRDEVDMGNGETRKFLQDGDVCVMRGRAGGAVGPQIGFGECRSQLLPAKM